MSTVLIRTVFLTVGILLYEKIHCLAFENFQQTPPPDFPTTTQLPPLQPVATEGIKEQAVTTTKEYATITYDVTTTVEQTSLKPQPSPFADWPSPPPPPMKAFKRYLTPETLTASTVVSTPESVTEIHIDSTANPVSATTTVVTPKSETVTTTYIDTALELEGATSKVNAQKKCPSKQSLFSQKDIKTIVNFQINNMNIAALLENSFCNEIISFKENIKGDLEKFFSWFEERPSHLKHILEYLNNIRERIQKDLSKKNSDIQEYSVLENQYNAELVRVEKLLKKIKKYKNICKYNCDEENSHDETRRRLYPSFVEKRQSETNTTLSTDIQITKATSTRDEEKFYCSYVDDLVYRVKYLLLQHLSDSEKELKIKITSDSKMYKEQVEELKNLSKLKALAQFGTTMYDLLNLQDQYHHIEQELQVDSQARIHNIRTLISNMGASLLNFEYQAEKLRKYCSSCSSPISLRRLSYGAADDSQVTRTEGTINKDDLVENITLDVYTDYANQALFSYQNVFKELDGVIAKSKNQNIANLQQIQEEIAHMTAQEMAELQKLKDLVRENSIDRVVELENKSTDLNQRILTASKELRKKIPLV